MTDQESQSDDGDRVLIRPSTCSTFIVKKNSVGHVPHEPVKGAVVRGIRHVPFVGSASTAAHGGYRVTDRPSTKANENKPPKHSVHNAISSLPAEKDCTPRSLSSLEQVSGLAALGHDVVAKTRVEDRETDGTQVLHVDREQTWMSASLQEPSLTELIGNTAESSLFVDTTSDHTSAITANSLLPSSSSEIVERLETEVVNLKEQLVIQSKVNADLKKLLVASIGDDLHHKVDALVRTKNQLATEINDYTKKLFEDYEDLDKLSIQADIWHSKYKASRVLVEQLSVDKRLLSAAYDESVGALQQMLTDSREMHTLLLHTHTTLEALRSHVVPPDSGASGCSTVRIEDSSVEIARRNRRMTDEVCVAVLRTLPAHVPRSSPHSCLSPSEALAYKVVNDSRRLTARSTSERRAPGTDQHHQLRFNSCTRCDAVTFNCCRSCRGDVHVV